MLRITPSISLPLSELTFVAIRAQGPGGQNVNKVSTAIQLRFDIDASSLSEYAKNRIRRYSDRRITSDGIVVIKAQTHRTQTRNRAEAIERLQSLLADALYRPKIRRPTRPTRAAKERRLTRKNQRGTVKNLRGRVRDFD